MALSGKCRICFEREVRYAKPLPHCQSRQERMSRYRSMTQRMLESHKRRLAIKAARIVAVQDGSTAEIYAAMRKCLKAVGVAS
jgi:hypothetical protein